MMKHCPVTSLPITEKSKWFIERKKEGYIKKYSIIGTDILLTEQLADHDITLDHIDHGHTLDVIRDAGLEGQPVYLLLDCRHIGDIDYSYKKDYTNLIFSWSPDIRVMVMFNINPSARLVFEMFQAIAPQRMPVLLVDSYAEAITVATRYKAGTPARELVPQDSTAHEEVLKKEYLAALARMLWLKMYDQHLYIPPEGHSCHVYFKALELVQRDLKALEREREADIEELRREFNERLMEKTTALNAQIELNRKNTNLLRDEKSALLSKLSTRELEASRMLTAAAEKNVAIQSLCDLLGNNPEIAPGLRQRVFTYCHDLFESGKQEQQLRTELTEADATFISKLQKRHPNLTQRELKICLLIKFDYNSREISQAIGLTVRGIESIRYRLHKKVGLGRHRSLKTYLTDLSVDPSF